MKQRTFSSSLTTILPRQAAVVVGVAFLTSVLIVTWVDDYLLANFVIPGDTSALARDIEHDPDTFFIAAIGYLGVLVLDTIIGLALFVVLKPANARLAVLTAAFRLLYAGLLAIAVLALLLRLVDVYSYGSIKLYGYAFFAIHIFLLGLAIIKSDYVANFLGVWLIIASFTYAAFFVDAQLPQTLSVLAMLIMASAEVALSVWLIVKKNRLPTQ